MFSYFYLEETGGDAVSLSVILDFMTFMYVSHFLQGYFIGQGQSYKTISLREWATLKNKSKLSIKIY